MHIAYLSNFDSLSGITMVLYSYCLKRHYTHVKIDLSIVYNI